MYDSKLEERMKNFRNSTNVNLCRKREEFSLNLRKNQLFDNLMEKRLNNRMNKISKNMEIDPATLVLPQSENEKVEFLVKWIIEQEKSHAFGVMSDSRKFALYHFRLLLSELDTDEQEVEFDKNFIEVLLYELYDSREVVVKCEISQILVLLTYNSNIISEFMVDVDILSKLLELSYSNYWQIVENILLVLGNIIGCNKESHEYIYSSIPLIMRLKEMLTYEYFDGCESIRPNVMWIIRLIAARLKEDKCILFVDFLPIFARYFELNLTSHEEILYNLLQTISYLSRDDKIIAENLIAHNILVHIFEVMNRKELLRPNLISCLRIIGNLLAGSDSIVENILNYKIVDSFEKIINTYRNSCVSDDKYILIELIWALSNITAGIESQVDSVVLYSNLPKTILHLNKFKKDNKILKETLYFFYNALHKGSSTAIQELMKLDIIDLVCDAINNSDDNTLIEISFNCVLQLLKISKMFYNTHMNVKNELIGNKSMLKIEKFTYHKNEKLSKKATQILTILDLEGDTSNEMDYEI